ncbi:glycoside hydrolase domain-containing protein [Chengkuizengella axinellae]|uniref:DUF1906 domain-containing protein n=1 Tax=Chengkuizengella axinellae TaxID=3064388 RepID=A0ABT9IU73_9BACL|nr:glycoside hydrolase domain-containing protein [Chengkuizengella sp. 2205SS18-9]MDP5272906.1 DUF1906 domain-containing protein [Chengkuizengella sp. 2205SS18-9]
MSVVWGVDSSAKVTKDLYDCVLKNFGKPDYWGRYLTTIPNVSDGLSKQEVQLLHNSETKVLPIYNNFREAVGYDKGRVVAQNSIYNANLLGIPKGTIVFANVEKFFKVDEAWIRGFVDRMYTSDYKPGIYHDPVNGDFGAAYCTAVSNDIRVADQLVLWSAEPEPGTTRRRNAPSYKPTKPPCKANVWGWQYGRDSATCPIDTNLIDSRLYDMLW